MVIKLKVVNETSDRPVDINRKMTKNEKELLYILQNVQDDRQQFPNYKKETRITVFN